MISESNRWMNKHQLKRVMTKQGYFNNKASCRSLAQTSFCNQQWSTAVGVTRNGTQWRPWDMEKNHSIDHSLNNTWQYHLNVYQYTCCITLYRSCIYIQKHWIGKDVYFSSRVIANTRTAWKLRPGTAFHDYLGNERSFSFYLSLSFVTAAITLDRSHLLPSFSFSIVCHWHSPPPPFILFSWSNPTLSANSFEHAPLAIHLWNTSAVSAISSRQCTTFTMSWILRHYQEPLISLLWSNKMGNLHVHRFMSDLVNCQCLCHKRKRYSISF